MKAALAKTLGSEATPRRLHDGYQRIMAKREAQENIRQMEAFGSHVIYRAVDVTDPASVAGAVAEGRAIAGPVTGAVHGAGVLADRLIEDKTDADFRQVYATKVDGLRALLDAVGEDALS